MPTNNATNTSNPITVPQGGSSVSSLTAYTPLCGGTTSTGAIQSVASLGSSAQVLTSNGAGALPSFQAVPAGKWLLVQSQSASNSATLDFTTSINTSDPYFVLISAIIPATNTATFQMQISNNAGSSWVSTGYSGGFLHGDYGLASLTNNNSATGFQLSGPLSNAGGNNLYNASFYFYEANVGNQGMVSGVASYYDNTAANTSGGIIMGSAGSTGANGFRFLMSTGNITSGKITVFRISST